MHHIFLNKYVKILIDLMITWYLIYVLKFLWPTLLQNSIVNNFTVEILRKSLSVFVLC